MSAGSGTATHEDVSGDGVRSNRRREARALRRRGESADRWHHPSTGAPAPRVPASRRSRRRTSAAIAGSARCGRAASAMAGCRPAASGSRTPWCCVRLPAAAATRAGAPTSSVISRRRRTTRSAERARSHAVPRAERRSDLTSMGGVLEASSGSLPCQAICVLHRLYVAWSMSLRCAFHNVGLSQRGSFRGRGRPGRCDDFRPTRRLFERRPRLHDGIEVWYQST